MALENDAKLEGKLTCASKNDMRNLGNFIQSEKYRFNFRKYNSGTKSK